MAPADKDGTKSEPPALPSPAGRGTRVIVGSRPRPDAMPDQQTAGQVETRRVVGEVRPDTPTMAATNPHRSAEPAPRARTSTRPMTELLQWARSFGAEPQVALDAVSPSRAALGKRAPPLDPSPTRPVVDPSARYAAEGVLGRGGVGEVDLVLDHDLGRRVAKKRLRDEYQRDPTLLQAFLEEAMITGALEHPGIVPVYDLGVSAGEGPWYTMKRLEGEPLSTILSRLRQAHGETLVRWTLPRLVEVFVQVLRAVAHAHERMVIHCDLKPGNVLVGELGEVVVVDWGLAKVMGEGGKDQARARLWSGSPGYMPPEQATSDDYEALTEASDIWALGAILYELMTLAVPQAAADGVVPEPTEQVPFPPLHDVKARARMGPFRRETPAALVAVAERAIRREPVERYLSTREMLSEVESWLQGTREQERREARIVAAARAADAALVRQISDVGALGEVTESLVEALAMAPGRPELVWRSSALYWHIFRLLHVGGGERADCARLLDRLAAMVVPAPESTSGIAPWLEALDEVADEAPHVQALAERLRALHATPLFASLDGHELLPVASAVEVRRFVAGEALVREGEPGDALYVLVRGTVAVTALGKVLNELGPPACFGEVALVDRSTRTASVVAQGEVTALRLTGERFDGLVKQHGAIALGVMRLLAERLRLATEREVGKR